MVIRHSTQKSGFTILHYYIINMAHLGSYSCDDSQCRLVRVRRTNKTLHFHSKGEGGGPMFGQANATLEDIHFKIQNWDSDFALRKRESRKCEISILQIRT